jgi:Nif-specific regulatory protein
LQISIVEMSPKLVALSGPMMGTIVPLVDEEVSIGREKSNQLCLRSMLVSRRHCVVRNDSGHLKVSDLESTNGTFVNSVPVRECVLKHGDQLRVGESVLQFFSHEEQETPEPPLVELSPEGLVLRSTVEVSTEEVLELQRREGLADRSESERVPEDLDVLVKFGESVGSVRGVEPIGNRLLETAFKVAPAARGAVILAGNQPDQFDFVVALDRVAGRKPALKVSQAVVRRALEEGMAIMSNDVVEGADGGTTTIGSPAGVRSILVTPLTVGERKLGVVYLESGGEDAAFEERHMQVLTVMASVAAPTLEAARHTEWLEGEYRRVVADISSEHRLVGESPAMQAVRDFIARVAGGDSSLLLCGDSGTGKEVVARAIHDSGPRSGKPFVAINCSALAETLLESELFGHEKGAFTGAVAKKSGKLEVANGGTVFLDEIGEMNPASQVKLLRVLDEHKFERVGGTRLIELNVRVIAATNRDLKEAIRSGAFREDLFYRLNVVSVTMPPLRERSEDIPLLGNYFVARHSARCKRRVMGLSQEAHRCLMAYDWPGNVRELENAIERAVVLGSSEQIQPEDLPETVLDAGTSTAAFQTKYHLAIRELKRGLILKAVKEAHGNYVKAAKSLGLHPKYLHRLASSLDLKDILRED